MFKPVHGLRGTLLSSVGTGATSLVLDFDSMALLRSRIGAEDYTYALIRTGYSYEVVKIVLVQIASVTVDRGQDGTTAQAFSAGSQIEFVLGEAAIQDIIDEKLLGEIHLTGTGVAEVTKLGPNTYNVFVPTIYITSESEDIIVEGEYPEFVISAPIKSDCCG